MIAPQPHTGGLSARPRCGLARQAGAPAPDTRVDPQLIVEFSVGDDMPQRLNFEGLELLAGLHHEGRVRAGVCHHPDDAPSAMPLAGILGVPAQREPETPVSGPLRRAW
jgi:hypothetical protein